MMGYLRALLSPAYWRHGFSVARAASALLSAFGGLWLLVETSSFFSAQLGELFRAYWAVFLMLGLVLAACQNRPRHYATSRLAGRDVTIEIRVGDIFSLPGALVIGATTTFETDIAHGLISARSVQGQFTERFYDAVSYLNADLAGALASVTSDGTRAGTRGKTVAYPIGTTVRVVARGRPAYFVAIASLNEHGVAHASFDDLKTSLPQLWEAVATKGDFERLVMPVLGSGFARLPQTREEIIRETVKSFAAACSSVRPTEALTIVMPYADFYEHRVDLPELERYLQHVSRYTEYRQPGAQGAGQAVT